MPRPKLVETTDEDQVYDLEYFIEEAAKVTKPYPLKLAVYEVQTNEETGEETRVRTGYETVEVPPPSLEDMRVFRQAQLEQDVDKMADSIFDVYAQRVLDLLEGSDYIVINTMARSVMSHYGRRIEDLGES
jgi:hypothetical protein